MNCDEFIRANIDPFMALPSRQAKFLSRNRFIFKRPRLSHIIIWKGRWGEKGAGVFRNFLHMIEFTSSINWDKLIFTRSAKL